nr:MAG TPA: hypothetical protein [Caudoviricetes sp.]
MALGEWHINYPPLPERTGYKKRRRKSWNS